MGEKKLVNEKTAKKLIKLIKGKNISQISITNGSSHITVKQKTDVPKVIMPSSSHNLSLKKSDSIQTVENTPSSKKVANYIKSENIGIFHTSSKGKILVESGKVYEKGHKLALVTAMKIDSEIKAPCRCKILNILAGNNSIVEYGTSLFEIEAL
ncbi:MAG: hypothetical protein KKA19_09400 [Candidatus Margulisbacteria bacterium]|nr:hypothetical protein [Candidatus Margulisiibacteriota bacterium]